ncbi:SURF1 family protein [Leucothrix sargassi]|nr:SURF1 family protein [Leucothrix sargassi]
MARFNYSFKPTLIPTLAFLVVFPVLLSLGQWQLNRAEEKREIERGVEAAMSKPALLLNQTNLSSLTQQVYRAVKLEGRFDTDHQYLWDNKTHKGKSGYYVLTPFVLKDTAQRIIVNRGWVPILGRRDEYPDISVSTDQVVVEGVIKMPSNALQLSDSTVTNALNFPLTIQAFEPSVIMQQLGVEVLPIMVELSPNEAQGYVREWQPYYGKIGKHIGYAVQWFIMALIALFLYIKLNIRRKAN